MFMLAVVFMLVSVMFMSKLTFTSACGLCLVRGVSEV